MDEIRSTDESTVESQADTLSDADDHLSQSTDDLESTNGDQFTTSKAHFNLQVSELKAGASALRVSSIQAEALVFRQGAISSSQTPSPSQCYALLAPVPSNAAAFALSSRIDHLHFTATRLLAVAAVRNEVEILLHDLRRKRESLHDFVKVALNSRLCQEARNNPHIQDNTSPTASRPPVVDTRRWLELPPDMAHMSPVACGIYVIVASLHLLKSLPLKTCAALIASILALLNSIPALGESGDSIKCTTDMRTILSMLGLDATFVPYITCPKCHQNHTEATAPEVCGISRAPDDPPCSEPLFPPEEDGVSRVAFRRYLHRDINEWIAETVCQYEDVLLPNSCRPEQEPSTKHDIWDAPVTRDFRDIDGSYFFWPALEGDVRLLFTLHYDGFNPLGNRIAGKQIYSGGLYMACLNLPSDIRYKAENMLLVGVIPGPSSPSEDEINSFLRLIIDDILPLWYTGIHLQRTRKYTGGRHCRAVIIPLVCDSLAANQLGGSGYHSSGTFCTYCHLPIQELSSNLDPSTWKSRTCEEHREHAEKWNTARTFADRKALLLSSGYRYTPLLDLPYWDSIKMVVIDMMHLFFLNIIERHCRTLFRMNSSREDGDGSDVALPKDPFIVTAEEWKEAHSIFHSVASEDDAKKQLVSLRLPVLKALALHADLRIENVKSKKAYAEILVGQVVSP